MAENASDIEAAIRKTQKISRAYPDNYLPHLKLGILFARKVASGDKTLRGLMEREMNEAVANLPAGLECHEQVTNAMGMACFSRQFIRELADKNRGVLNDVDRARITNLEIAGGVREEVSAGQRSVARSLVYLAMVIGIAAALIHHFTGRGGNFPPIPAPVSTAYSPGTSLILNGDGSQGMNGWNLSGQATVMGGEASFHMEGGYSDTAMISQEVGLPNPRPAYALVIAKARSSTEPGDGMSGLPYLWGTIRKKDGSVLSYLAGGSMLLKAPANEWGVCWGAFELGPDGAAIMVSLQQALRAGGSRYGITAEFDDVAVYLFNSPITARKYAEQYNGEPPSSALLAEDAAAAPLVQEAAGGPTKPFLDPLSTNEAKNLAAAKAMYDRVEPGMSQHAAGVIMGFDSPTTGWGKDFGQSLKPSCVTLNVRFKDGLVAWVALSKDYEPGNHVQPGRILEEKGTIP
jgi:hypothetical protein